MINYNSEKIIRKNLEEMKRRLSGLKSTPLIVIISDRKKDYDRFLDWGIKIKNVVIEEEDTDKLRQKVIAELILCNIVPNVDGVFIDICEKVLTKDSYSDILNVDKDIMGVNSINIGLLLYNQSTAICNPLVRAVTSVIEDCGIREKRKEPIIAVITDDIIFNKTLSIELGNKGLECVTTTNPNNKSISDAGDILVLASDTQGAIKQDRLQFWHDMIVNCHTEKILTMDFSPMYHNNIINEDLTNVFRSDILYLRDIFLVMNTLDCMYHDGKITLDK